MSRFKAWMKHNNIKVKELTKKTTLHEKTVAKLRSSTQEDFKISTFTKLKKAYPEINLKELFPEFKNLC